MATPGPTEDDILAFIAEVDRHYPPNSAEAAIETQRARYDALCRNFDAPLPKGLATSDETAAHPDGLVPLRRDRPAGCKRDAMIVYFHGGGFVVGGLLIGIVPARWRRFRRRDDANL